MGSRVEENYCTLTWSEQRHRRVNNDTDESFARFNTQVLANRANMIDFHVSRTADSSNVLVKSHVI